MMLLIGLLTIAVLFIVTVFGSLIVFEKVADRFFSRTSNAYAIAVLMPTFILGTTAMIVPSILLMEALKWRSF